MSFKSLLGIAGVAQSRSRHNPERKQRRILIIAPHCDDEAYGCGGLIAKRSMECEITMAVVGVGGIRPIHSDKEISYEARLAEAEQVCEILNVKNLICGFPNKEMLLDTLPRIEIVSWLDNLVKEEYDEIYYPYPSHNRDHVVVYDSVISALRHPTRSPALSFLYEYPFTNARLSPILGGRCYVDITHHMDTKLRAINAYKSQLRTFPQLTSEEAAIRLAKFRGMESGYNFAELFYLQTMRV
jgi:LmbE family N-acetylglucosaminyl deacetylase